MLFGLNMISSRLLLPRLYLFLFLGNSLYLITGVMPGCASGRGRLFRIALVFNRYSPKRLGREQSVATGGSGKCLFVLGFSSRCASLNLRRAACAAGHKQYKIRRRNECEDTGGGEGRAAGLGAGGWLARGKRRRDIKMRSKIMTVKVKLRSPLRSVLPVLIT